ncbi:MAG TPA: hypothetical protein VG434_05725 [Sphingomicrobium sp.]|nr:hypothetical protein [Sphingomicrobium sp.]
MSPILYWTLLTLTCGYALTNGRSDERIVGAVCVLASVVTAFALSPWRHRYSGVETGELLVDIITLGVFVFVALRSQRFWPLWVAGLQLTTSMSHMLKAVDLGLGPQAYAAAEKFWSYPILLILTIGTWRGHRRMMAQRRGSPAI